VAVGLPQSHELIETFDPCGHDFKVESSAPLSQILTITNEATVACNAPINRGDFKT